MKICLYQNRPSLVTLPALPTHPISMSKDSISVRARLKLLKSSLAGFDKWCKEAGDACFKKVPYLKQP